MSITLIFKNKERLPYGSGSRGKFVPPENGRRGIFVPSWGALEKEEIDYIVTAEQEKEDERIKKREQSITKQKLEYVTATVLQAPEGKRAEAAQESITNLGG